MKSRARIAVLVIVLVAILVIPSAILSPLGAANAGSMIGLGGLGIAFLSFTSNLRVALLSSVGLGITAALVADGASLPALGVAAMVLVAASQGLLSRWGWHRAFTVVSITLGFIASESVLQPPLDSTLAFALAITGYGIVVALAMALLIRRTRAKVDDDPGAQKSPEPETSWDRSIGYAAMLAVTTAVTTTLVLLNDWGHTGGWLIMTPFIVIQPTMRDGMPKAINRALGTIAGFALAYIAAEILGQGLALTLIGYTFAVVTVVAMVKKWNYALYATFLTPAVVILESVGRSVQEVSDHRLVATLLGVGISLIVMAIAIPIYTWRTRRQHTASESS